MIKPNDLCPALKRTQKDLVSSTLEQPKIYVTVGLYLSDININAPSKFKYAVLCIKMSLNNSLRIDKHVTSDGGGKAFYQTSSGYIHLHFLQR